ncbi:MAG TPA: 4-hydroxy-tetrahydrodipicolinate reductase [Clostridiales bacterium]|nr:4-hydroxy-tetrahydrodipicolinate reductase [Clostridiales bacterium]
MLNIIINGINGKTGKAVYAAARREGINVVCGVDVNTMGGEFDCPVYKSTDEIKELADVIIDFSVPSCVGNLAKYAAETGVKLVICTTGLDGKTEKTLKDAAEKTAVFYTSNTSLGIFYMRKVCMLSEKYLKDFDAFITEIHHKDKKDAPSGTAKTIAADLGIPESGILSVRGGSVFGEHTVLFLGKNEKITITHEALSRDIFADGAIRCARFIKEKTRGLYGMQDLSE